MRNGIICHNPLTFKRSFAFPFRGREVYTSVERIHCLPLWVDGSRWNAGHCYLGRWAATQLAAAQKGREKVVQFPQLSNWIRTQATVSELAYRIKTVSLLVVLIGKRMPAERKQTPQVVESLRNR